MEHSSGRQLALITALTAGAGIILLIIGVANSGSGALATIGVSLLIVALLVYVAYLAVDAITASLDEVRRAITGEALASPETESRPVPSEPWLGGRSSMIEPRQQRDA